MAAVSLALGHQVRVDAEGGVVDEDAPVHRADIDGSDPPGSDDPHCAFEVERQPEIPRKVVQGAERQNPQWEIRAGEHRGGGPYAAVSATDDDRVEAGLRASPPGGDLALYSIGDTAAWHNRDRRVEIVRRAQSRDLLPRPIDP